MLRTFKNRSDSMQTPAYLPPDYGRIEVVNDISALTGTWFSAGVNCRVLRRELSLDFNPLARMLQKATGLQQSQSFGRDHLESLLHKRKGAYPELGNWQRAAEFVIDGDMKRLSADFTDISLRAVVKYARRADKLHEDDVNALCAAYNGPATCFARNEDAVRLSGDIYDLKPGARLWSFRAGDMWHQAGWREARGNAFLHLGPAAPDPATPRLLLMAVR
jgi:hypothetical protein